MSNMSSGVIGRVIALALRLRAIYKRQDRGTAQKK